MVLHLFCKAGAKLDTEAVISAAKELAAADHQVVPVSMLGHKADACFLVVGPDMWRLRQFQTALRTAGLDVVDSYVSLTEISEYAEGLTDGMKRPRLYPSVPPEGYPAFCFYPMSKKRGEQNNWFALPFEERKDLMHEHGVSGRRYAGRVWQLVTSSTGLDDFEWAVSLFAKHPDDLKAAVYEMRYDRASTLYGEFGSFYTGMVADFETVLADLR